MDVDPHNNIIKHKKHNNEHRKHNHDHSNNTHNSIIKHNKHIVGKTSRSLLCLSLEK